MQGLSPLLTFIKIKKLYIFMSNYSLAISLPLLCQKKKKVLAPAFSNHLPLHFKIISYFPSTYFPTTFFFFFLPNPLADNHPILNISIFLFSFLFLLFIHPPKPPHSPHFFFLSLCWLGFVDFFGLF
jgi:hypothetical protein